MWQLHTPDNWDLYAPAIGPAPAGPYSEEPGYMNFNEVSPITAV